MFLFKDKWSIVGMHHTGNDTKCKEHTDPFTQCEFDKYHTHRERERGALSMIYLEKCVSV